MEVLDFRSETTSFMVDSDGSDRILVKLVRILG
jgi:hypothetical protein